MSETVLSRPELTFPSEVSEWVREHYEAAKTILEYGSGGSTVMAAEMPGKTIFSVESDKGWTRNLQAYLDSANPKSMPFLHHAFIGKTGRWGRPQDHSAYKRYHRYALDIWDQPEFKHPDLVLIDGRFREACFYAVMMRCTKKTIVLFDDYDGRAKYKRVEQFVKPLELRGRMAKFELTKKAIPREGLTRIIGAFANPF